MQANLDQYLPGITVLSFMSGHTASGLTKHQTCNSLGFKT